MSVTKRTTREETKYPIWKYKKKINIQATHEVYYYLNIRYLRLDQGLF